EKELIYKHRKITFKFIWRKLTVDGISPSCLLKYFRDNGFETDLTRNRKKAKVHKKNKEKFYKLYEKLNVTIKHNVALKFVLKANNEAKLDIQQTIKQMNKAYIIKDLKRKAKSGISKAKWGEVVEIDACQHRWFGNELIHVYLAVDKSTGYILAYHIEKQETTAGYIALLTKLFKIWGIPKEIRTDKRTTFWKCRNDGTSNTPLAKALQSVGCVLLSDSNPNFKAIVENTFGILQTFLPAEASLSKILTLEEYIPLFENEIEKYNETKLQKKPKNGNFFTLISDFDLESKFVISFRKTVTNAKTVLIDNKHYELEENEFKCRFGNPGFIVSIKESYFNQGNFWYSYGTTRIKLIEVDYEVADAKRIEEINSYNTKYGLKGNKKVNY
ncbi:MAG: hypothetical protein K2L64_01850, partial [Ureaplasma sp.]|nr:hypothetical protein [Ureaplasma sp.]